MDYRPVIQAAGEIPNRLWEGTDPSRQPCRPDIEKSPTPGCLKDENSAVAAAGSAADQNRKGGDTKKDLAVVWRQRVRRKSLAAHISPGLLGV